MAVLTTWLKVLFAVALIRLKPRRSCQPFELWGDLIHNSKMAIGYRCRLCISLVHIFQHIH